MLQADVLTLLSNDTQLSGTVRSISSAGVVELDSGLSPDPLMLKYDSVRRIDFSKTAAVDSPARAMVELVNGDRLPVLIENLDKNRLVVLSPEAGRLEIPRDQLKSLQLGTEKHKVIYSGPRSLEEWISPDESKKWVFEQGGFKTNGMATASKELELPLRFILRFTLNWEARQTPNFIVYFADPLLEPGSLCDRYFLQFGSAGMEIKREASEGKKYNPLKILNRTPDKYPDRKLKVELRVDRKTSRMRLFINDEDEGIIHDPIPQAPEGLGITITCNGGGNKPQWINQIEVLDYNDTQVRHRTEERGPHKADSLISTDDDRWSGELLEIRASENLPVFLFKSDFQEAPLEIPETKVSTVFFSTKDVKTANALTDSFVLKLQGEGSLKISSCRMSDDVVMATHQLLGELKLKRGGVVALEKSVADPKLPAGK